ncbi:MAG: hypothetical protein JSS98_07925 [Bacteroidetes bacterium]|nr:hypothetical protein [Bacteroidota bacterium]
MQNQNIILKIFTTKNNTFITFFDLNHVILYKYSIGKKITQDYKALLLTALTTGLFEIKKKNSINDLNTNQENVLQQANKDGVVETSSLKDNNDDVVEISSLTDNKDDVVETSFLKDNKEDVVETSSLKDNKEDVVETSSLKDNKEDVVETSSLNTKIDLTEDQETSLKINIYLFFKNFPKIYISDILNLCIALQINICYFCFDLNVPHNGCRYPHKSRNKKRQQQNETSHDMELENNTTDKSTSSEVDF